MIFVGIDWAEDHHDVCILDAAGRQLARFRIVDGLHGLRKLHGRLADHAEDPDQVVIGLETDRGLLMSSSPMMCPSCGRPPTLPAYPG